MEKRKFKAGDIITDDGYIRYHVNNVDFNAKRYACSTPNGRIESVPFANEDFWELVNETETRPKFKVGDIVVRIDNLHAVHKITCVDNYFKEYYVDDTNYQVIGFEEEELWKIKEDLNSQHKFKIGDVVFYVDDCNNRHEITYIDEEQQKYYVDGSNFHCIFFCREGDWELVCPHEKEPSLINRYEDLANNYLSEFVRNTGIEDNAPFWVGNDVGGCACVGDYFIDYQTIRTAVDRNVSFEKFDDWYCYCNEVHMVDDSLKTPTLEQWLDNEFVRIPHERLEEMNLLKKQFEAMVEEEKSKQ